MSRNKIASSFHALLIGALAVSLAACVGPPPKPVDEGAKAQSDIRLTDEVDAGPPVYGGTLDLLMRLEPSNLDPHTSTESAAYVVMEQMYEPLLESVRGKLVPALAESWDISKDGLTYTFKLRGNATFHSGRSVTAADVKYSIERIQDPATASPRAESFAVIKGVRAEGASTVVIELANPSAPLLIALSGGGASIVDRDVVEAGGLNGSVDGGSGPFMLAKRDAGQRVGLEKNPNYWNSELPYLDGITFTWSGDDNARAAAIRSGTVDFLWRAAPEFIDSMKADKDLKWYGGAGTLSLHLRLNTSKAPFNDVRVRQAIYLAIDRQELVDTANSGQGTALNAGYLPPDRYGAATKDVYGAPDIQAAQKLMAEAGYKDGFDAHLMAVASSAFQTRQAEVLQQQLAKIGITIKLDFLESTVTSQKSSSGDFDMSQTGATMSADPDEKLSSLFYTGGGSNYGNWSDAEYDKLIDAARVELDVDAREAIYQKSERILAERGPVAMTFVTADFDIVRNNVQGYDGDPTPSFRFYKKLWLDE